MTKVREERRPKMRSIFETEWERIEVQQCVEAHEATSLTKERAEACFRADDPLPDGQRCNGCPFA